MTQASKFNLSRWAMDHPALTRYLLVVLMVLGFAAYFQLRQDEDPPFTFRAMAVRTYWPGATAQQVAEPVTDKLERTLQKVSAADAAVAKFQPRHAGISDRAARYCWCGRCPDFVGPTLRICGFAGRDRAQGRDPAQLRDPD